MSRIIIRKLSSHVLGVLLCLIGLVILVTVFWRAWSDASASASSNVLSSLWAYILTEQVELASMVTLKLVYPFILGTVFLVLGVVVIAFSRQVFHLSGETVLLKCPYCRNSWKANRAKGWAECPHCRKFVQPQVAKK